MAIWLTPVPGTLGTVNCMYDGQNLGSQKSQKALFVRGAPDRRKMGWACLANQSWTEGNMLLALGLILALIGRTNL